MYYPAIELTAGMPIGNGCRVILGVNATVWPHVVFIAGEATVSGRACGTARRYIEKGEAVTLGDASLSPDIVLDSMELLTQPTP